MNEQNEFLEESWWLAAIGDTLVWARLRTFEAGPAQILDCNGDTVPYDSEDSARAALLDGEYRAFDGLDPQDADQLGFDLDSVEIPHGDDEDELRDLLIIKRPNARTATGDING